MRQFEQDWLELGRRVACSLHYQHPRNLRVHAARGRADRPARHSDDLEVRYSEGGITQARSQ